MPELRKLLIEAIAQWTSSKERNTGDIPISMPNDSVTLPVIQRLIARQTQSDGINCSSAGSAMNGVTPKRHIISTRSIQNRENTALAYDSKHRSSERYGLIGFYYERCEITICMAQPRANVTEQSERWWNGPYAKYTTSANKSNRVFNNS
jgi:hypothetical protein